MANKQDRRGRSKGGPSYVMLYNWLQDTPAWRSMGPYSKCLYIEIRRRYNGTNNGAISFSYREAEELLGCSNKPVPGAFRELQERGFIVPVQKGAFSWKVRFQGVGRATTWRLGELPQDIPIPEQATHDFKNWQPKNKTRHAESGPKARPKRAISEGMARHKRANDTPRAGHSSTLQHVDGTPRAGTYISTISPTPVGDVTRALLNSRIVKGGA